MSWKSVPVMQIAEQSRVIVAQEQKYAQDVNKLSLQLMRHSAAAGIQSFSPLDFEDDADDWKAAMMKSGAARN